MKGYSISTKSLPIKPSRESNVELLRLICMFMIVLRHFIFQPLSGESLLARSELGQVLDSLCYIGVNCFILISGWFTIKFSWKGLFNLFFICAFYGTLAYVFHLFYDGGSVGKSLFFYALMPFSHSCWWFINAYLILYLTSPLINLAVSHLDTNQDLLILVLLTIINVYFGNIWQTPLFNDNGFNGSQMIYLYWIGICLRRHFSVEWISKRRIFLFGGYILASILLFFLAKLSREFGVEWIHLGYNNIVVLLSSICFFLSFVSFQFHSRFINYVAASALAVYLIQENTYFGFGYLYPLVGRFYEGSSSLGMQLLFLILFSLSFFILAVLLDQIRRGISLQIIKLWNKNEVI